MDEHTESRVREELHRAVGHLQVSPDLWARIQRRHRREPRQRMFAVATSLALVTILAVAAFPLVRDAGRAREPIGGTGPSPSTTPSTTPVPPGMPEAPPEGWNLRALGPGKHNPTGSPVVLAHGTSSARDWTGGRDWTLVAYPMDGGVCFGFLVTPDFTRGQGWCLTLGWDGFVDLPQHLNPSDGFDGMALGIVDKDAARVRVTYPSGRTVDLTARQGGLLERDGLPVDFYLDLIPEGEPATSADEIEVRAFDRSGRELGAASPDMRVPTPSAVQVYFMTGNVDPEDHTVYPVTRQVTGAAVASGAMQHLLAGPTPAERQEGLVSAIPEGTELRGVTVEDGIATVDLSGPFGIGGGAYSPRQRVAQIVFTLTQFPTVDAVLFQLEGEPVTELTGEGLTLDGPQTRDDWEGLAPPSPK